MKKKQKSTTNQQTSLTTTPTNPEWSTGLVSGLAGQIGDLSKADPYSFIAGPDPLQTQAGAGAAGLTVSPNYGLASDMYTSAGDAGAADIAGNISKFYDPWQKDVVDTSLADYDFGAGQARGQAALDLANDTTFGGSGGALLKRGLESDILRGRGALSAGIRSEGYKTALGGATSQAQLQEQALQRKLQAASGLTSVGQAQGVDQRANIATQASIGDILQKLAQQRAGAPLTLLGTQAGLAGSLPLNMFTGQQANGTMSGTTTSKTSGATLGDWLNALSSAAGAAVMASDERLKRDIETVGYDRKGHRWVEYSYVWDGPETRHRGVIAQEARRIAPEAVIEGPSGILFVDYSKLEAA